MNTQTGCPAGQGHTLETIRGSILPACPGSVWFFEEVPGEKGLPGLDLNEDEELDDGSGGKRLACRLCRQTVTSTGSGIRINGQHRHVFFNPNGNVFEIGCFVRAAGCQGVGGVTSEFTWFSGYDWQVGICRGCHSHLGWIYRSASGSGFYGLILGALVELDEE